MLSLLKILLSERKHRFRLLCLKAAWRKRNKHNYTTIVDLCNTGLIEVGKGTYGSLRVSFFGADNESLKIGNWCSIRGEYTFCVEETMSCFS